MPKIKFHWEGVIKLNTLFLKHAGLWPSQGYRLNLYTLYTLIVLFFVISFLVLQGMEMFLTKNVKDLLELMLAFFGTALIVLKMCTFILNFWKIEELMEFLQQEIFQPRRTSQVQLVNQDLKLWHTLYSLQFGSASIGAVIWLLLPTFTGAFKRHILPFKIPCPKSCDTDFHYILMYVFEFTAVVFCTLGGYNIDMFILALFTFIGAQCEILVDNLQHFEVFDKNLLECIVHHQNIVHQKCNDFFDLFLLFQFFATVVNMSVTLFQVAQEPPDNMAFCLYVVAIITVASQIFGYCLFGDRIQTKSTNVPNSAFHVPWTGQTLASKKILLIFLTRTQSPIRISTVKLFYLSFETFLKIMKSSWSYFMVLEQLSV